MTCAEVERVLPELLEGAPDSAFQSAFDSHLRSCPDCADLVSDLRLIASQAGELKEVEEPSPRVWLRLEQQLRAEGLIKEPASGRPELVSLGSNSRDQNSRPRGWSAWWLAPITAAILAAGAYVVNHRPAPQVATQTAPAILVPPAVAPAPIPSPSRATQPLTVPQAGSGQPQSPAEVATAAKAPPRMASATIESAPSAEDQQFLSVVSTQAPAMRATYQDQLRAVNHEIQEVQSYLERNPEDADARQHLMEAYQQKTLLYQIALDRIQ